MCITCMSVDRQKHEWRISGQLQERTLQVRQTDRVQKIVSESSPRDLIISQHSVAQEAYLDLLCLVCQSHGTRVY